MYAVRNIKLCTKDCLCLYVCPTGATDTENGQIDSEKCISGCRLCVDACGSNAISLVPHVYPYQQKKEEEVIKSLNLLSKSKANQEQVALSILEASDNIVESKLAKAISLSNRIMTEDIIRESGYMLPQSKNVKDLLQSLLDENKYEDFPKDVVVKLLKTLGKSGDE